MDDLISRKALLEFIYPHAYSSEEIEAEVVLQVIESLPTVTPEPRWIPVTERLPD